MLPLYVVAKFENNSRPPANLDKWFPDTQAQSWPLLFGVVTAEDPQTVAVMSAINSRWDGDPKPNWAIDAGQIPGRLSRLGSDGKKAPGLLIQPLDLFSRDLLGRSLRTVDQYRKQKWPIEHESELLRKRAVQIYNKRDGQIGSQGVDRDLEG